MDKERIRDLFQDATVDCYDEDEQFWGLFYTLAEEGLNFPLKAKAMGEDVELVDLDGASSPRRGIVALVHKGGKEHSVALAELELVEPDSTSAEWLEVYRYWLNLS